VAERTGQRSRTRKDLLQAAARLMHQGRTPTLEEVAAEAMISRATAYRYFPGIEPLLVEAALDIAVPEPAELFGADAPADVLARVERLDDAFEQMMATNEPGLRAMLAHSLEQSLTQRDGMPLRQNRRTPLIEAALQDGQIDPAQHDLLAGALGMIIGTEALIALKDVLRLDPDEARRVRRWAIAALLAAARR